jgi:hypothetical protein
MAKMNGNDIQGVSKNFPVRLLGTSFEARNCIGESGSQEPCREFFKNALYTVIQNLSIMWLIYQNPHEHDQRLCK